MPRSVDMESGNLMDDQQLDVYQSANDRLHTALGSRAAISGYGFPPHWPQLPTSETQEAILTALRGDRLIDRVAISKEADDIIVDVYTDSRPSYRL